MTWAARDALAAGTASDGVTTSVRPDGSSNRFRCYSRSLPVPASGFRPGCRGAGMTLPAAVASASGRCPERSFPCRRRTGWEEGEDAWGQGQRLRPSPAWDEAWGLPCLGRPESAGSSRASSRPRPESLVPREGGTSSVRFPGVSLMTVHHLSLPPFAPPASLSIGETEAKGAVGQWPRHTSEGR